jgi:hypothetical protein
MSRNEAIKTSEFIESVKKDPSLEDSNNRSIRKRKYDEAINLLLENESEEIKLEINHIEEHAETNNLSEEESIKETTIYCPGVEEVKSTNKKDDKNTSKNSYLM